MMDPTGLARAMRRKRQLQLGAMLAATASVFAVGVAATKLGPAAGVIAGIGACTLLWRMWRAHDAIERELQTSTAHDAFGVVVPAKKAERERNGQQTRCTVAAVITFIAAINLLARIPAVAEAWQTGDGDQPVPLVLSLLAATAAYLVAKRRLATRE